MSSSAPSTFATTLGTLRYRLALAAICFGVFSGWLLACTTPLFVYAALFDSGGAIPDSLRWALSLAIFAISAALTYRCRRWIARKALEEAPREPVRIWSAREVVTGGLRVTGVALGVAGLLVTLTAAALFGYGGYLLLGTLSLPIAIVIGAIIIAFAIVAAFRKAA